MASADVRGCGVDHPGRRPRDVVGNRGHVPDVQAALELLYMAALNAQKNRGGRDRRGNAAPRQFAIHFEERIHERGTPGGSMHDKPAPLSP